MGGGYRQLYIFVEGFDDERFFKRLLVPVLRQSCQHIQFVQYAQQTDEKTNKYLRSVKRMEHADYVFVADRDRNHPCVTSKVERLVKDYRDLDQTNIIVVVPEIEAWYKAGSADNMATTDDYTKEDLKRDVPRQLSLKEFKLELIEDYSITTAIDRNASFKYFVDKLRQRAGVRLTAGV